MNKFLLKILPKNLVARIFLAIFLSFVIILSVMFTRNYLYTLDSLIHKSLNAYVDDFIEDNLNVYGLVREAVVSSKLFADEFENFTRINKFKRRKYFSARLEKLLKENPNFLGVWIITKPNVIDSLDEFYKNDFENYRGEYIDAYYRGRKSIYRDTMHFKYYAYLSKYLGYFLEGEEFIVSAPEKVDYPVSFDKYKVSIVFPVFKNDMLIGILGIDISTKKIENFYKNLPEVLHIILVSEGDKIIFDNKSPSVIDLDFANVYRDFVNRDFKLYRYVKDEGLNKNLILIHHKRQKNYAYYYLLDYNQRNTWVSFFLIPKNLLFKEAFKSSLSFFIAPLVLIISFAILLIIVLSNIKDVFEFVRNSLDEVSKGNYSKIDFYINKVTSREFLDILDIIKLMVKELESASKYAAILAEGNYKKMDLEFKTDLFLSLDKLRETLKEKEEQEAKQRERQEKERWHNKAITTVNEILRLNPDKEDFAPKVLAFLTDYIGAVQGGFFVKEEDEESNVYLDLVAFYSYNRQVYYKKKVSLGEGLVGVCALEKKPIHTPVPDNYIEITSGLGKAKPNELLIIPLVHENEVFGILEFTTLKSFTETTEKLLESISRILGATLSAVKINERTRKLLEQSKIVESKLEEKDRQIKLLQEQLAELELSTYEDKEKLRALLNALEDFAFVFEIDEKANIVFINKRFLEFLGITYSDALSSDYYILLNIKDVSKHQNYIKEARSGKKVKYNFILDINKREILIDVVLVPLYDKDQKVNHLLFVGIDNSELYEKQAEIKDLRVKISELNEQLQIQELEFDSYLMQIQELETELQKKEEAISYLEGEVRRLEKSLEFFKRELEKRIKRSKKIENTLKEKNKNLEAEIERLKNLLRENGIEP